MPPMTQPGFPSKPGGRTAKVPKYEYQNSSAPGSRKKGNELLRSKIGKMRGGGR